MSAVAARGNGAPGSAGVLRSSGSDAAVWVRVGTLIDGNGERPLRDAHIVYDATGIRYVGPASEPPPRHLVPDGATVPSADLPDVVALPGLIEAHGHLFLEGGPVDAAVRKEGQQQPEEQLEVRARARLAQIVATGVMAVRDAGDSRGIGLKLRDSYRARAAGDSPSAYIDSAGAAIHRRGRYGSFLGKPLEDFESPEACVEHRCQAGSDRIKVIPTGIINFEVGAVTTPPQLSAEDVTLLCEAARRRGRPTMAHASGTEGLANAIAGGVDTVEHGFFVSGEQLAQMRDRNIGWVPTFSPVRAQVDNAGALGWKATAVDSLRRILDGHADSLRRAADIGVAVLAGSDAGSCGVPHGLGLLRELELMEEAGMPSLDVLRSATSRSAARLGLAEPLGRLAPGHRARMIFARHSPLDTVKNLRRARTLIFDGHVIEAGDDFSPEGL